MRKNDTEFLIKILDGLFGWLDEQPRSSGEAKRHRNSHAGSCGCATRTSTLDFYGGNRASPSGKAMNMARSVMKVVTVNRSLEEYGSQRKTHRSLAPRPTPMGRGRRACSGSGLSSCKMCSGLPDLYKRDGRRPTHHPHACRARTGSTHREIRRPRTWLANLRQQIRSDDARKRLARR